MNNIYRNFFANYFKFKPFSIKKKVKTKKFLAGVKILNSLHYGENHIYKNMIDRLDIFKNNSLEGQPFLPVSIFKDIDFFTAKKSKITTIATSSGTSGSNVSKIFLDKENSINQYRVLQKILFDFFGNKKYPMLFLSHNIEKNPNINAKVAAINGFSSLANKKFYALDYNNHLNKRSIKEFLDLKTQKILFGFTHEIYKFFFNKKISGNFNNTIIIHGGGWKKLENRKIKKKIFNSEIKKILSLKKIINYYGMIEQTGSIFMECDYGYFHTSIFSEILVRDANFELEQNSKAGIIQVFSLLPVSYPGHNIVTEDIGIIIGEDSCKCGRRGKYFKILGRVKDTEVRGCANV